jgi:hypothetical protein
MTTWFKLEKLDMSASMNQIGKCQNAAAGFGLKITNANIC